MVRLRAGLCALWFTAGLLAGAATSHANQSNTWAPTTGTLTGLSLVTDYNNAFSALQSCNSGGSAPTNDQTGAAVLGQCWLNTSSNPYVVSIYDGTSWLTIGKMDVTNHVWIPAINVRTTTSNDTPTVDDCSNVVLAGTGTTGQFTETLPAAGGIPSGCVISITNGDTGRGKVLSGFPAGSPAILWPGQHIAVINTGSAWRLKDPPGRWLVPGATTVFVNSSLGSDSNDCLASGAGACATFGQAVTNAIASFDFGFNNVTIQLASATYTSGLAVVGEWVGAGGLIIDLGTGTVNVTNAVDIFVAVAKCNGLTAVTIQNGTLTGSGGSNNAIHVSSGCVAVGSSMTFAAVGGNHIVADGAGSRITFTANYSISGGAGCHYNADAGGTIDNAVGSHTATLTGTPAFSTAFACALGQATAWLWNFTYSGSATGPRYSASANSTIVTGTSTSTAVGACSLTSATGTGTSTYFPGNSAGSIINNGCYF